MNAADWIASGSTLTLPHHAYRYVDRGAGPLMLLLHGFPTWSYDWVDVAAPLAQAYRVVAPDFLGYGASDKPRGDVYSVTGSADFIEHLVAHLGDSSVHLVAHDYGSIVAQELLDRRRRGALSCAIEALTILNASVFLGAKARLPQARVTTIDDTGHFPQSETPQAVAAALLGDARQAQDL